MAQSALLFSSLDMSAGNLTKKMLDVEVFFPKSFVVLSKEETIEATARN